MRFSRRTPWDLSPNPLSKALEGISNDSLLDLTESNPTQCGFTYPPNLLEGLASPAGLKYEPFAFGHPEARRAVAGYFKTKGEEIPPENILLAASTSEAYSYLFKLLADPGDSFLVPSPGYPLLDHLISLEGANLIPYSLQAQPGWPLLLESINPGENSTIKGLVTVNPHNPTGSILSPADLGKLGEICRQRDWAYISDEVFADFVYPGETQLRAIPEGILSFRLGGLSKSLGLPQLKLSWMVLSGPKNLLEECKERLELIADTYLSVGTPVQLAMPELLSFAPIFQKQLLERVLSNRAILSQNLRDLTGVKLWPSQGGWYALVQLLDPEVNAEDWVIQFLKKEKVLVQPGGLYDFEKGAFLVLSLLPQPEIFREGTDRLRKYWGAGRG